TLLDPRLGFGRLAFCWRVGQDAEDFAVMEIVAKPVSRALFFVLIPLLCAWPGRAAEAPPWLPHYDLDIQLQVEQHRVVVHERVTWTNRHARPAQTIVLNNHSHFRITSDIGLLAKMLEILRLAPSDAMDFEPEAPCQVQHVSLVASPDPGARTQQL